MPPMRICLMLEGQEGIDWDGWLRHALAAEAAGLDGLFRSDHYGAIHKAGGSVGGLDAWATLAAIAARTERLRLGTLVSPTTFRPASVLAKSVVTVDQISSGRVEMGIGAGWLESEHTIYNFPFMSAGERFDEFERQLAEIERQWTSASDVWPKPVQEPHPPIIVGGGAKPRSVRAAIRYAAEYNTAMPTLEQARERCAIVQAAAQEAGREPLVFSILAGAAIGRDEAEAQDRLRAWTNFTTLGGPPQFVGTVEQVAEQLQDYAAAGVSRVMLQQLVHTDVDMVPLLGELARAVA
jgi:alkanesulfonate monooxygenase SsuD/methylene tetrahydromethanopterin reductase-like flavin-dependent oxidoreductase (luciferase family)